MWGAVLKRDLLGETREEDKFRSKEQLIGYLRSEIEKQGENVSIRNLDVSLLKDLSNLFYSSLVGVKTLDLSGWKTSGVKNMCSMFFACRDLESLDVTGWDTSSVEDMNNMFWNCDNLESLDLSGWDTSNVKHMSMMFMNCFSLESLDLSGWDASNADYMNWMFGFCKNLKSLNLPGWDVSNVKSINDMFLKCPAPYEVVNNKIIKK